MRTCKGHPCKTNEKYYNEILRKRDCPSTVSTIHRGRRWIQNRACVEKATFNPSPSALVPNQLAHKTRYCSKRGHKLDKFHEPTGSRKHVFPKIHQDNQAHRCSRQQSFFVSLKIRLICQRTNVNKSSCMISFPTAFNISEITGQNISFSKAKVSFYLSLNQRLN